MVDSTIAQKQVLFLLEEEWCRFSKALLAWLQHCFMGQMVFGGLRNSTPAVREPKELPLASGS